jgi:5-methylcytosine-specific restriction endonuclease McrA
MAETDDSVTLVTYKVCKFCGVQKPTEEFPKRSDGLPASRCSLCHGRTHKPCLVCKAVFFGRRGGNYCSPKCRGNARSNTHRTCPACGKRFRVVGYQDRRFCDQSCYHAAQRRAAGLDESGDVAPTTCLTCQRLFKPKSVSSTRVRLYCGPECFRNRNPVLDKGCPQCGGVFKTRNIKRKHCSKVCASRAASIRQAGENSHLWAGGTTKRLDIIRFSRAYREWRAAVFKRDGYACVDCGIKGGPGTGITLDPDHIIPKSERPDLATVISNGRTLCRQCHEKTETYGWKQAHRMRRLRKAKNNPPAESLVPSHEPRECPV